MLAAIGAEAGPCAGGHDNAQPVYLLLNKQMLYLVHTKPVCAHIDGLPAERTFTVRVLAGNSGYKFSPNTQITIKEKQSGRKYPEIRGENSAASPMEFQVTVQEAKRKTETNSMDYSFWIKVPGLGELDPKVRVIRAGPFLPEDRLRYNDVVEALGELEIEPWEAVRLIEEFHGPRPPQKQQSE